MAEFEILEEELCRCTCGKHVPGAPLHKLHFPCCMICPVCSAKKESTVYIFLVHAWAHKKRHKLHGESPAE